MFHTCTKVCWNEVSWLAFSEQQWYAICFYKFVSTGSNRLENYELGGTYSRVAQNCTTSGNLGAHFLTQKLNMDAANQLLYGDNSGKCCLRMFKKKSLFHYFYQRNIFESFYFCTFSRVLPTIRICFAKVRTWTLLCKWKGTFKQHFPVLPPYKVSSQDLGSR